MSEDKKSDDKLMSLISHLAVIIPNIGVVAPIVIWITQKDRSEFVRFNAIQAIFFQLVFFALIMLSVIIGFILMFIAIPLMGEEPTVLFWVSMGIMSLYFPLWILFSVYAIVAGVKSFRGKIFRYLIIGRIIERRVYK